MSRTKVQDLPTRLIGLDALAVVYLSIPLLLFNATFLVPLIAAPICLATGWALFKLLHVTKFPFALDSRDFVIVSVAIFWTLAAGILGPLYQNGDWIKHYALINALSTRSWPPEFEGEILRYALGYYLVPAIVVKVWGSQAIDWAFGAWTIIGLFIALKLISSPAKGPWQMFAMISIFILFSGADYLGTEISGFSRGPAGHLEWWAHFGEIPSQTTSMLWTPQHAIPAWIAVGLFVQPNPSRLVPVGPVILASIAFWSPLVAVSLIPLGVFVLFKGGFRQILRPETLVTIIVAFPALKYLLTDTADIPIAPIWLSEGFSVRSWVIFQLLEWAMIATALWFSSRNIRPLLSICVGALLALSIAKIGIMNDLLMRGSVPYIAILSILSAREITNRPRSTSSFILVILLVLGLPTPANEIARGFQLPRLSHYDSFDFSREDLTEYRRQYFSRVNPYFLRTTPQSR